MRTQISRRLVVPALAILSLAGVSGTFMAASTTPASALCRYGTPHCVNPNPGQPLPKVGGVQIPPSDWHDPECVLYGNCNTTSSASRGTGVNLGRAGMVGKAYTR